MSILCPGWIFILAVLLHVTVWHPNFLKEPASRLQGGVLSMQRRRDSRERAHLAHCTVHGCPWLYRDCHAEHRASTLFSATLKLAPTPAALAAPASGSVLAFTWSSHWGLILMVRCVGCWTLCTVQRVSSCDPLLTLSSVLQMPPFVEPGWTTGSTSTSLCTMIGVHFAAFTPA